MGGWLAGAIAIGAMIFIAVNVDLIRLAYIPSVASLRAEPVFDSNRSMEEASSIFSIYSPAFGDGETIPATYTCDGNGANPPLRIQNAPPGTRSLVLIVDDPDVPKQLKPDGVFDHWVLFNISPATSKIDSGEAPGVEGRNGAGKAAYVGPCPPREYEPSEHRYLFKLYALDSTLELAAGSSKDEVERAMEGHIIARAQLTGRYRRP